MPEATQCINKSQIATKALAMAYTSAALAMAHTSCTFTVHPNTVHITAKVLAPRHRAVECECAVHTSSCTHTVQAERCVCLRKKNKKLPFLQREDTFMSDGIDMSMLGHWTHTAVLVLEVTPQKTGCTPRAMNH
jgi:hypothetical protein